MTLADSALRDFGQAMGVQALAFGDNGVASLQFERSGMLSIERTADGAVMLLARPVDQFRQGVLEKALTLCHFDRGDRLRPEAGLSRDGALVFSVRLDERAMDLPTLEAAFEFLSRLHDQAAG